MEYSISLLLADEAQGVLIFSALNESSGFEGISIVQKIRGGCDIEFATGIMPDGLRDAITRICSALNNLKGLVNERGTLCVAVYFEGACCSTLIAGESLSEISLLPLDLEISCYPCAPTHGVGAGGGDQPE